MHILVSNDDGYSAPGIRALARVAARYGRVTVVAPERNASGASHSLTITRPLQVTRIEENVYACSGTPADCVHVSLTGLFEDDRPDLVLSGINDGTNLGEDAVHSGTVAAALAACIFGVPSMAFSLTGRGLANIASAEHYADLLIARAIGAGLPARMAYNVNVPNLPLSEIAGIEVCRGGRRAPSEAVGKQVSPRGFPVYWLGRAGGPMDGGPGTDFHAIENRRVSIVPLDLDLTAHGQIGEAAALFGGVK